jgi:hypothetical protein
MRELTKEQLQKEINDRINYFYLQIDGNYDFPNSKEGDLLKMVNKLLKMKDK